MTPPLRGLADVHEGVAPAWWPPAPGWWLLLAVAFVLLALLAGWLLRRRRRRREVLRLFDQTLAMAANPAERVAAISQLLRRAARLHDPDAAAQDGEEWLRLLDRGMPGAPFGSGPGALLRDGAYRADVDAAAVDALLPIARERYLRWMRTP